jgi:hypothetical protein
MRQLPRVLPPSCTGFQIHGKQLLAVGKPLAQSLGINSALSLGYQTNAAEETVGIGGEMYSCAELIGEARLLEECYGVPLLTQEDCGCETTDTRADDGDSEWAGICVFLMRRHAVRLCEVHLQRMV